MCSFNGIYTYVRTCMRTDELTIIQTTLVWIIECSDTWIMFYYVMCCQEFELRCFCFSFFYVALPRPVPPPSPPSSPAAAVGAIVGGILVILCLAAVIAALCIIYKKMR